MTETKDKIVTVESLSALHEHNKKAYMSKVNPAGVGTLSIDTIKISNNVILEYNQIENTLNFIFLDKVVENEVLTTFYANAQSSYGYYKNILAPYSIGDRFKIVWDGIEYDCLLEENGIGSSSLANDVLPTEEDFPPFWLNYNSGNPVDITSSFYTSDIELKDHTLSIYKCTVKHPYFTEDDGEIIV